MTLEERNKRVEENLPLVTFCLKKLGKDFNEDYFQQGILELIRCVNNFDESKGIAFSTYAVKNIKLYLKEYIMRDKVLKPKRWGGTAKVYSPPCDSFDEVIYNQGGNEIKLGDTVADRRFDDNVLEGKEFLWELDLLVTKKLITQLELDIFLEYYMNGLTKTIICKKYKLDRRFVSDAINNTMNIVRNNLSYND